MLKHWLLTCAYILVSAPLLAQVYPTPNMWPHGDAEAEVIAGDRLVLAAARESLWDRQAYGLLVPTSVGDSLGGGQFVTVISGWQAVGNSLVAELRLPDIDLSRPEPWGLDPSNPQTPAAIQARLADLDAGLLQLELGAYFGGTELGNTWEVFRGHFHDDSGNVILSFLPSLSSSSAMSYARRNLERTLLYNEQIYEIPSGTRVISGLQMLASTAHGSPFGFVDNVRAVIGRRDQGPEIVWGEDLIDNGGFELPSLVNPGATLAGHPAPGWTVLDFDSIPRMGIGVYGSASGLRSSTSRAIGGGSQYVRPGLALTQRLNVRYRSAAIDAGRVVAEPRAFMGGDGNFPAGGRLGLTFRDASGNEIPGSERRLEVRNFGGRNGEPELFERTDRFPVPVGTREIAVTVRVDSTWRNQEAAFDNVSLRLLESPAADRGVPLGLNVLVDSGFESGPNDLCSPFGWETRGYPNSRVTDYGSVGVPTATNQAAAGGSYLWQAGNNGVWIQQEFVIESEASRIDSTDLGVRLAGWFGALGAERDAVTLQVHYFTIDGAPVPSLFDPSRNWDETDPVTAAERHGVTDLVRRNQSFIVPPTTRRVEVRLVASSAIRTAGNDGLADNVSAVFFSRDQVFDYPGTAEDLQIASGINGIPTAGPSQDVKNALAGDVLSLRVSSPASTYLFRPLLLAAQLVSGSAPPGGTPGLGGSVVNFGASNAVVLLNPFDPSPLPPVVLPGGSPYAVWLPNGTAGWSVFVQAFALDVSARNGVYAATNGHEIRIR